MAIKALAIEDDEFRKLFIDWLPFETTLGEMTFGEYRRQHQVIRYAPHIDSFRQIARVAAAQGLCVINAGYSFDSRLLDRAPDVFPDMTVEVIEADSLAQSFDDLSLDEQKQTHDFLVIAESALRQFRCFAEMKKFQPSELPALFSTSAEGRFLRSLEQSREIADPLWSGVLSGLDRSARAPKAPAQLCFNLNNPLVRRLTTIREQSLVTRSVQMLYVQALLLGHHPLTSREMSLLNDGLLDTIQWGLDSRERSQS
jgi:molecular chaperone HtpG